MELIQAQSTEQVESARELFNEYAAWLGFSLCFENFEKELTSLPGDYAPPQGRLLLAIDNDHFAGCVALREIADGVCEMKRLYVRPAFRGTGLGRALVDQIIEAARQIGYRKMRLDTIPGKMDRALAMYPSLGFEEIERYRENAPAGATFLELKL